MEKTEITYHEGADGMLYPDLELPETGVKMTQLDRFAVRAAEYLEENYRDRYLALVMAGKQGEKMQEVEEEAVWRMEVLEDSFLKTHRPQNPESTMEMWQLRQQARMSAEETVMAETVLKYH